MRNIFLAAAAIAVVASSPAHAAPANNPTRAELQALQAQMLALSERMNRLEVANAGLQLENSELQALADRRQAETDHLTAQTSELREQSAVTSSEIAKVKDAGWASRIKARGDFRYRHDTIRSEYDVDGTAQGAAQRDRDRIRARLGIDATVTEDVVATLLFATGGDDPRGTNQTLGGESSRKSIGLDLAFADWRFMSGGNLVLGKQPNPIWRPLNSLFQDSDVNPEGGALRFVRDRVFANAFGFWVTEQFSSDPDGENSDANLFGLQLGTKFEWLDGETILAAKYTVCGACKDNSPLYANDANGNTTYLVGTTNTLQYGYDIFDVEAQVGTNVMSLPLVFTAGFARNLASGVEYDTAYSIGVNLGRAADPGSWEAAALYQAIDKDALFGQIFDSDFGDGQTDSTGWVLKGGYAPIKNMVLNAAFFLNTVNKDVGTELDFSRMQLDVNYRF